MLIATISYSVQTSSWTYDYLKTKTVSSLVKFSIVYGSILQKDAYELILQKDVYGSIFKKNQFFSINSLTMSSNPLEFLPTQFI